MKASGYAYPIIEINFRYLRPAKYGQQLTVRAILEEYQNRLRVAYLMLNEAGEECCKGYTVQVAVHALTKQMSFVTPSVFQQLVERSV
jgi:acyl-CoA thioester hydrolase